MKKIGIMSMQRIKNYGSFMQSYCLKEIIERNIDNSKVEFIDYRVESCVESDEKLDKVDSINIITKIKRKFIGAKYTFYYNYIWLPKYLNIHKRKNYNTNIDYLVIGSDEVFNCTQSNKKVGFSRELFGKGYNTVISYAASFGYTTIERLKKFKIDKEVGMMLNKFKKISVRDNNSYKVVKELIGIEPIENLDPVLVSNINKKIVKKIKLKNYIIVYSYSGRINKNESEKIREYAKKNNKIIISLGTYQECADKNLVVDPFKMLAYFKDADCIITDTFHGTIFSVIFNKNFVTLIRKSNIQKLGDLLSKLKLTDRQLNNIDDLEKLLNKDIDYNETNIVMKAQIIETEKYLKENL